MIEQVIDLINNGFDGLRDDEKIIGLTEKLYRSKGDDSVDFMPGVIGDDGEAIYAGIDDVNSLLIYHRSNAAQLTFSKSGRSGYGNARHNEDNISLSLIAVWDIRKMKIQSPDMLFLLRTRMPQQIVGVKDIHQITVSPTSALLNTKQIFDSEYKIDGNYLLPNYINFVQINYTLQFTYNPECIERCINC